MNINKDIIDSLITLAETQMASENAGRWGTTLGSSSVDAYRQGVEDGEIESARQMLGRLGVDYTVRKED